MAHTIPQKIATDQKLTRIYSDHRKKEVLYRVEYFVEEQNGCKIYTLQHLEELE